MICKWHSSIECVLILCSLLKYILKIAEIFPGGEVHVTGSINEFSLAVVSCSRRIRCLSLPLCVSLLCVFCYATRSKSTGHTAKWHVRQHKLHILGSTLQYADAINHNKRPHCANAANDDSRTMGQRRRTKTTTTTTNWRKIELCLVGRGKALQHAARSAGQHLSPILAHAIKIGLLIILAKGHGTLH